MVWCEAIIAYDATINAETDTLEVMAPTSLTTRTGRGKPKITHALALTSTDDVQEVWILPSGYSDPNGIPIECVCNYGAVNTPDIRETQLSRPIEVPENTPIQIYARSETAANTVVIVWLMLEYPGQGPFESIKQTGGLVRRAWEHGAALVSVTPANSTDITDLQAGKMYQPAGCGNAAVNGATAGCVGPVFWGVQTGHSGGAEWFVPLMNSGNFVVGGGPGWCDFARAGLKSPVIAGGQPFKTRAVGYTAEQPQAVLELLCDKVF